MGKHEEKNLEEKEKDKLTFPTTTTTIQTKKELCVYVHVFFSFL